MRVLHLSTGDNKGAFTGAYRVHRALIKSSISSVMFVAEKNSNDTSVLKISKLQYFFYRLFKLAWKIVNRIFFQSNASKEYYFLNDIVSLPVSLLKEKYPRNHFDFIFVYYTSNFLSTSKIASLVQYYDAKLIVYPMDMGPMTGGCHYSWECNDYKISCNNCRMVDSNLARRIIRRNYRNKNKLFKNRAPVVLAGSELLRKQLCDSDLFKHSNIHKCLLPIDESVYSPDNRVITRKRVGLKNGDIAIYFGAQSLLDPRKGVNLLIQALNALVMNIECELVSKLVFLSVGAEKPAFENLNGARAIHLDYISDEKLFSSLYAAADVFISPSIEDSGPMMVNESILSGTPVISFKTGVALDIVIDGVSGFLCSEFKMTSLEACILKYLNLTNENRLKMRASTRQVGLSQTSVNTQSLKIISILNEVINGK